MTDPTDSKTLQLPMQEPSFQTVALDLIVPSLTNPRKTFNQDKLQELANSIAASGVHQPVLVRPLPAARIQETFADRRKGDPLPAYELVAGERRLRASRMAQVPTIPVIVRALTDDQVLEIQIIENLQRDDLSALEEAEGYDALMRHGLLNADQVAEKIGKSRSYVYARLKLLDLCQAARASLRDGLVDASRALLVARIPDEKLQIKAMKEIVSGGSHFYYSNGPEKEPMGYRRAAQHIQQNYMLKLVDARFKITDAGLVPEAGSCKSCTKRTGHDPDLFSDVKGADVCTDPSCFHQKEDAQARRVTAEARAKGQTVVAGREAQELVHGYDGKLKGYRRLDSTEDSPTGAPLRKLIGALMKAEGITPVLIESHRKKGELIECLPNETALKLLKLAEATAQIDKGASKEVKQLVDEKKAQAEKKAVARYEQGWRDALVQRVWDKLCHIPMPTDHIFTTEVHRLLAVTEAHCMAVSEAEKVCTVLDLGQVAPVSAVIDEARKCKIPSHLHLLILMARDSDAGGGHALNKNLMLIAGNVLKSTLDDEIRRLKLEVQAVIFPKLNKTTSTHSPAARRVEDARKGKAQKQAPTRAAKLSAKEASLGIADAMQSIEGSGDSAAAKPGAAAAAQGDEPLAQHAGQGTGAPDADDLFKKAVSVIRKAQKVSVRLLKGELGIGTDSAMALMAQLETTGKVSACNERGARKVLVAA